ncbi:UNVERIFIED_CONTAM: hypothetical protein PYX00_005577 [Menopon gallinae]|uniref:RRM domain-containing protein n=1 Tax=Menopon gallinae TaxID=328185 RepID=A0AAW2HS90_9NEOP
MINSVKRKNIYDGSQKHDLPMSKRRRLMGRKNKQTLSKDRSSANAKTQKIKQEPDSDGSESGEELPYWVDKTPSGEDKKTKIKLEATGDFEDDEDIPSRKKVKVQSNDVEEGKTLFIRNLPFSVTNEDLKSCFAKFGELEYALVCIDKLTEHSKGTGFVKFKDKKSADECLLQNNKLTLEDNPLLICLAVSRDNLEKERKQRVAKDSRNLYLAKEGVVMAGSPAARGVSAEDMAKRLQIEQWKSQMLKNLNMFISNRRMVIHNLPQSYDDAKLKALFGKYSNPNTITEARVMRDKKKFDGKTGLGIPKGYGFVTFTNHDDALTALRNINNNPEIFSIKKRPIVTFSIESRTALNAKQKRLERSRAKLGIDDEKKSDGLMKLNRKQRRFIKRRQQFIEKRRERQKMKKAASEEESVKKCDSSEIENGEPVVKKKKTAKPASATEETAAYCGTVSKPGTKVKLRSRFKLKNQALIHKQVLKEEKSKLKRKKQLKVENVKQPKQKQNTKNQNDDSHVSKLIKKHRKALESVSSIKKWDER